MLYNISTPKGVNFFPTAKPSYERMQLRYVVSILHKLQRFARLPLKMSPRAQYCTAGPQTILRTKVFKMTHELSFRILCLLHGIALVNYCISTSLSFPYYTFPLSSSYCLRLLG